MSIRGERRGEGSKWEVEGTTVPREFGGFPRGGAPTGAEEEEGQRARILLWRTIEEELREVRLEEGLGHGFYSRGTGAPREVCTVSMAGSSAAIGRDGGAGMRRGAGQSYMSEDNVSGDAGGAGVRKPWCGPNISETFDEMSTPGGKFRA